MSDSSYMLDVLPDLAAWGLFGLALCSAIEKLVPILPSIALFLMLGMLGVANPVDLPAVIAVTAAGSTAGSLFWYGVGCWLGPARGDLFVLRMTRRLDIKEEWYLRLKRNYHGHAIRATLFGQLVPIVRAYMALPAGVLAIPAPGFAIATFCGALIWNTPFLVSGYLLRQQILAPDAAAPAAVAAIILVNLLLLALLRFYRPSRSAA
ncbi:alkaline phosphatase [Rhizobium sp. ERR 922]|uniref:DedA family protein n=1 Tax=unclassified Rhizobium TaxID=2613769 RepID=UPI0011AB0BE0|nr:MULTISPECIES: DedA family protein [unclassified Rhizobium]TWB58005.1 alkaline phosphatase [Rhizobium sp. ERR 922]TWB99700.1 alkaline phosphatase [Rhizobium sp. ERR 942]